MSERPSSDPSPTHANETQTGEGKGRKGFWRAALELTVLATIYWPIMMLFHHPPPRLNLVPYGPKWLFFTYGSGALFVLGLFLLIFTIGALSCLVLRKNGYWTVYRYAFVITVFLLVLGSYGLWFSNHKAQINMGLPSNNMQTELTVRGAQ